MARRFAFKLLLLSLMTGGLTVDRSIAVPEEPTAFEAASQRKMRRLHLVRPDLLVFPVQFPVFA
jgi:hypothetical protein